MSGSAASWELRPRSREGGARCHVVPSATLTVWSVHLRGVRLLLEVAGTDSPRAARGWYAGLRAAADGLNLEKKRLHSGPTTWSRKKRHIFPVHGGTCRRSSVSDE
ncbi:hypothetical protein SMD44_06342 [Streptomyces alboflavus]|uniref:Uncharacterized protein n=1 Tax=Streptomyces alboflavus TaxID=67267 RepID=A0A1Z1WK90_9ACTN|nr:hypothetical protein SMD44_06342 [Streptomyces alboflavus]